MATIEQLLTQPLQPFRALNTVRASREFECWAGSEGIRRSRGPEPELPCACPKAGLMAKHLTAIPEEYVRMPEFAAAGMFTGLDDGVFVGAS